VLPLDPHGPIRALHDRIGRTGLPFARAKFTFTPHATLSFYPTLSAAALRELLALRVREPAVIDRLVVSHTRAPQPPVRWGRGRVRRRRARAGGHPHRVTARRRAPPRALDRLTAPAIEADHHPGAEHRRPAGATEEGPRHARGSEVVATRQARVHRRESSWTPGATETSVPIPAPNPVSERRSAANRALAGTVRRTNARRPAT
jgi:hypothetical protein